MKRRRRKHHRKRRSPKGGGIRIQRLKSKGKAGLTRVKKKAALLRLMLKTKAAPLVRKGKATAKRVGQRVVNNVAHTKKLVQMLATPKGRALLNNHAKIQQKALGLGGSFPSSTRRSRGGSFPKPRGPYVRRSNLRKSGGGIFPIPFPLNLL